MENEYMNFYRLEYNETQGGFHFDNYTHKRNTHGWFMLCPALSDKACMEFVQLMKRKYYTLGKGRGRDSRGNYPTFLMIKDEFKKFIKE